MRSHPLIIGGDGYVGQALVKLLSRKSDVCWTYFRNGSGADRMARFLDLRDSSGVTALIGEVKPDIVYHVEYNPKDLDASIMDGTRNLIGALADCRNSCPFIYLSTDALFDGELGPYRESDLPRPVHPYGAAKRKAEKMVLERGGVVVRTSLVYGFDPPDTRTLELLKALKTERFPYLYFTDETRCLVFMNDLCEALIEFGEGKADEHQLLHVAGPEALSRYDFAVKIAECLGHSSVSISHGLLSKIGIIRSRDLTMDIRLARHLLSTELRTVASACAIFQAQERKNLE